VYKRYGSGLRPRIQASLALNNGVMNINTVILCIEYYLFLLSMLYDELRRLLYRITATSN